MSVTIYEARDVWPYTVASPLRHEPDAWCEVTEAFADESLCVLPPIYVAGGFMVSEPFDADSDGATRYLCVAQRRGRYFARILSRHKAPDAIRALHAHLEAHPRAAPLPAPVSSKG